MIALQGEPNDVYCLHSPNLIIYRVEGKIQGVVPSLVELKLSNPVTCTKKLVLV